MQRTLQVVRNCVQLRAQCLKIISDVINIIFSRHQGWGRCHQEGGETRQENDE